MSALKIRLIWISICFIVTPFIYARGDSNALPKLIIFESSACSTCAKIKNEVVQGIEKEFKNRIEIEYRDIGNIENYKLFLSLQEKSGVKDMESALPVFYFEGRFLQGKGNLKEALRKMIAQSFEKPAIRQGLAVWLPKGQKAMVQNEINLLERFKSFKPLAIVSAGLIDGINPCAFTVMVFFISFLALQGYKKRHLIIVGLSFMCAVFVAYVLIGLGLFGFLYRLKGFWLFSRFINISIGIFSIILGILAFYDFLKFKKSQLPEEFILQLPKAVKNRIHTIIGLHYRRPKGENGAAAEEAAQPQTFKLFVSALATGFLISILEAVCTGQVYLPTITFVLKTTDLKAKALLYLLLYNLMFIIPLFVIFLLGLLGVTSGQFSKFFKKHLGLIKILMAVLFFALGIFLLWRA